MGVIFNVVDRIHNIIVKFVRAYLPEAKKPYYLKPVHQPTLDIHGVASKADVYNIGINPKVIEDGLTGGLYLIRYLAADGYRIKTPLFDLHIRVPGEYDGTETCLPEGLNPMVRLRPSTDYRGYVKEHVKIDFSGEDQPKGLISEFFCVAENAYNIFTAGSQFVLTGSYIRACGPDPSCGVYFVPVDDPSGEVKVTPLAKNSRSEIIGICPQTGHQYNRILIRTQYMGSSSKFLKTVRTIQGQIIEEV